MTPELEPLFRRDYADRYSKVSFQQYKDGLQVKLSALTKLGDCLGDTIPRGSVDFELVFKPSPDRRIAVANAVFRNTDVQDSKDVERLTYCIEAGLAGIERPVSDPFFQHEVVYKILSRIPVSTDPFFSFLRTGRRAAEE